MLKLLSAFLLNYGMRSRLSLTCIQASIVVLACVDLLEESSKIIVQWKRRGLQKQ